MNIKYWWGDRIITYRDRIQTRANHADRNSFLPRDQGNKE